MKPSMKKKLSWVLFLAVLLVPVVCFAQTDPFSGAPTGKQLAQNAEETTNSFFSLVQALVCFVGFILTCLGIYGFYKVTKEKGQGQSSIGMSLAGCVVGVLMIMLPLTVGTLGKSLFGDQAGRPARIDLSPQ